MRKIVYIDIDDVPVVFKTGIKIVTRKISNFELLNQ
jgi:hypothetical protein